MKKKLVIDVRMINMSGIGTYLKNIIPNLIKSNKFEITCLGYSELRSFKWFNQIQFIGMKSKILSIQEQFELFKKIPSCDIFWSPNWNIPLFPIKAKERIVTIHDVYHLANPANFSRAKILVLKVYMLFIKLYYHKILTVSNFSKAEIVKYAKVNSQKVKVIPLSVSDDFDIFKPEIINVDRYVLYVGNVKPHKNLLFSLKAFELIDDKDIKFIIVGKRDGFITNDAELDKYLMKLTDRVIFTGKVSDNLLKNYYKNAALFLFPSIYEGFGLPILEAMKFKLPIISSNTASMPEVGGNCILYFNPYNLEDLVGKLNGFLSKEISIDINKYSGQLAKFNWEATSSSHLEFLIQQNR